MQSSPRTVYLTILIGALVILGVFRHSDYLRTLLPMPAHKTPAASEAESAAAVQSEAAKGDASAQYKLGCAALSGEGGAAPDAAQAVQWLRKAAEQGHADACFRLGGCYMQGTGVEPSEVEGVAWYKRAAELGHIEAHHALIRYYREADSPHADAAAAREWVKAAARLGDPAAMQEMSTWW